MADKEASRAGRRDKLEYGAGSPTVQGGRFVMKTLESDIQKAADKGCQFYVAPFPQDDYLARMREFAREVMPSYTNQKRPAIKTELL